jgi:cytoskeletal protein RodZ
LISIIWLSQWIYADIVEYLQLTKQIQYLTFLLPIKWIIILFNIGLSAFLILSIFKPQKEDKKKAEKIKKEEVRKNKSEKRTEHLSPREKEFLTKKIRNESEVLMDK